MAIADEQDEAFNELPAGTILRITALIACAIVLVLVLAWLLSGGGAQFFRRKFTLHTYMTDAAGIVRGDDVSLNGVPVGKVAHVAINDTTDPQRIVRVDIRLDRRFMELIPVDSQAAVTETNIVGDEFININLGKSGQHVEDGAEIPSLIQMGSFNPADLIESLQTSMQRLDALFSEIQDGNTPLAQLVRGDEVYRDIQAKITYVQKLLLDYGNRKSPLGQEIFGDQLYNRIRQPILKVDGQIAATQEGKGKAGRYLESSQDYYDAVSQLHNVRLLLAQNNAGKGAAGQWLVNDDRYKQLLARVTALDQSVDSLTAPNTKFGALLSSTALYDSLNNRAAHTRDVVQELRETPQHFMRIQVRGKKKPKSQPQPAPTKSTP